MRFPLAASDPESDGTTCRSGKRPLFRRNEYRSRRGRAGKYAFLTKFEIRYEIVPRGFPGKARFILTPSSGDIRVFATQALSLSCGISTTRPDILLRVERRAQPLDSDLPFVFVAVGAAEAEHTVRSCTLACPLMTVNGTSE